jgi:PAS domain S-box-containing protein
MPRTDLKRLKDRLAAAQADVEGLPSARELEIALHEIEALWDELGQQADRLAQERQQHAALFDNAPFACLVTDIHGAVRDANLAALALLEVPVAYLVGKPLAIFVADEERESFRRRLAVEAGRRPQPAEAWASLLKSPRGRPRSVRISVRQMPDADHSVLLLWFLRELD